MKYLLLLSFLFSGFLLVAQEQNRSSEIYPQFSECSTVEYAGQQSCFNTTISTFILNNFKVPEVVEEEKYSGFMYIIFEVDKEGSFNLLYQDTAYPDLKTEMERVFEILPQIKPGSYNSRSVQMQFKMQIAIPLKQSMIPVPVSSEAVIDEIEIEEAQQELVAEKDEYDRIQNSKFTHRRYTSQLNIPLSHEVYSRFDAEINRIGTNAHSASKPFLYKEVNPYYNFEAERDVLLQSRNTWAGRKLWNEHFIRFETEDYWFTLDPGFDLQLGKDFDDKEHEFTYNNTRALIVQGGLGKNLNFYTVLYENQGRFAEYFNRYAESIRPDGGNPAIVPGRGIAKSFMDDGFDYPVAEGYLSYTPSKYFNAQFGHGKNFIGDGYRSLLLSDNASPYPYFKLNTSFWKIKYTNTWMSLRDVRPAVTADGSYRTKYMANHYLSLNITKRLNLGFFESVIWENDNDRGFDLNYLNPVIFYRAIEFSTGARGGNAIIGLSAKYKFTNQLNAYSQLLIDEFSSGDIFGGEKSWKNKLGFQLGVKYYDAFNVPNLFVQVEYNQVRPYTYSHNTITLNYGHNNQSMAHLWGANFREVIGIARYKKDRYFGSAKLIYGQRGFDFNNFSDNAFYGQVIYRTEEDRPFNTGVEIGQGNTTNSFYAETEAGYIINPTTNLKIYASLIYRDFKPEVKTFENFENSTLWINFGIKTDIFNWYFDY